MKLLAFEAIIQALHDAQVQYLVVGGVAVNAHGYIRFTPNIDLALELRAQNIRKAFQALAAIGYHPNMPIDAEAITDLEGHPNGSVASEATLLTFHTQDSESTPVNIVTQVAFDFPREYDRAMRSEILPGVEVGFLSISALIRLKERAGRPRDRDDIQHLLWLQDDYSHINENDEEFLWSMTSFEGARKMQLIRTKKLPIRKRLESLDGLSEVCEHLGNLRRGSVLKKSNGVERRGQKP